MSSSAVSNVLGYVLAVPGCDVLHYTNTTEQNISYQALVQYIQLSFEQHISFHLWSFPYFIALSRRYALSFSAIMWLIRLSR